MTYEEAKQIAIEHANWFRVTLDWAGELPNAYVFDGSKHQRDGGIPFTVSKVDGSTKNMWFYMQDNNVGWDDVKEIPF